MMESECEKCEIMTDLVKPISLSLRDYAVSVVHTHTHTQNHYRAGLSLVSLVPLNLIV